MMNNLSELYGQIISEHRKYPRNKGLIEGYKTLRLKNPSCGDDVTVQVNVENGIITDVRFDGAGCAICCSSASVMTETLKGKTVEEAENIINDFYELIKGNVPEDEDRLGEAIVYVNIHNFPPRVKCATLSWRAAGALLLGEEGEKEEHE
ncbi:MAG: SUF system NifU family Fe-S cluster assembly protein [Bacilli bacterium]|nr:SUF system NifU family Fe-S cluster assembly protein [Bacilli bacterium]MDD7314402.1 SUF system NifU family Fe-S cluster assembly protein [Bacilli bacterium]MDY4053129.1 SUF system NifU family Fe-S cluster assembly protein [Bacilli bacterium]